MLVRILVLLLALAATIAHGYRFRHLKRKLQRDIAGLNEDLLFKGGGYDNVDRKLVLRQKRVSDQRLAELETLVALSNMKGNIKTIPYGFGSVDPKIMEEKSKEKAVTNLEESGRKRRSPGVLLDRLMESIAREEEDDSSSQERQVVQWPPYFWSDQQSD